MAAPMSFLRVAQRLSGPLTGYKVWSTRACERQRLKDLLSDLQPRLPAAPLVRVGQGDDGGYLLPDDFDGITHCISPGVSTEISFDQEIAERGIDVLMLDASVDGPPSHHERFYFQKKFLGLSDNDRTVRLKTLCDQACEQSGDMILQMDIEGSEWEVLVDASEDLLRRFRTIIVEFHGLHQINGAFCATLMEAVFRKLLRYHSVVHIHPNNWEPPFQFGGIEIPPLAEFTFYRKDREFVPGYADAFPHPLDRDCVPDKPTVVLPNYWK